MSTNQNESDASDMSDYGDALGDEDWQDPQVKTCASFWSHCDNYYQQCFS